MRNRVSYIPIRKGKNRKRYYKPLKYPEIPLSIDDLYVITTAGDRLEELNESINDSDL